MTRSSALGRPFQSLLVATGASAVGTGMTFIALPLLADSLNVTSFALGVIAAASLLPGLLFAVPTGLLADRFDRKLLLVLADLGRAITLIVATILIAVDALGIAALVAVAFLIGLGETIYIGSSQALVPLLVDEEHLDAANGRLQAAEDTAREFVGPPLGSMAFALASWLPFVGDAVTYVLSGVVLVRMPSPPHEPPAERLSMRPAWSLIRGNRSLKVLGVALVVLAMTGAAVLAIMVRIVRDDLGVSAGWFGPFMAVIALGSTLAGMSAGRLRQTMSARVSMIVAVAVNAWAYMVLGLTDLWWVALFALFGWGLSVTYGMITSLGIRQRLIPAELLGRTMGLFRTALGGGAVIGALGGGALASATSTATTALVAGLVQLPVIALMAVGLRTDDQT